VERRLFVDLLKYIGPSLPVPLANYPYVGLGGPYLADFALLQDELGFAQMQSLETDSHVHKRQKFNIPHCRIAASRKSTGDFADAFVPRKPTIVWFDYSKAEWDVQIAESCDLMAKLPSLSIFKITLACVASRSGPLGRGTREERAHKLHELFEDYGPFEEEDITRNNLPKTLYGVLQKVVAYRFADNPHHAIKTLASFVYDDGTPILTVSLAVGEADHIDALIRKSQLHKWDFADLDWSGPKLINVPVLTLRERLAIDRLLPDTTPEAIFAEVKVALSAAKRENILALAQYAKYRKYAPLFVDIRSCN
jgi:hypothetical protein